MTEVAWGTHAAAELVPARTQARPEDETRQQLLRLRRQCQMGLFQDWPGSSLAYVYEAEYNYFCSLVEAGTLDKDPAEEHYPATPEGFLAWLLYGDAPPEEPTPLHLCAWPPPDRHACP